MHDEEEGEEEEEARILDRIWDVKIGTNEWYWKMYPAAAGYLVVFAVVSVEFPTELR